VDEESFNAKNFNGFTIDESISEEKLKELGFTTYQEYADAMTQFNEMVQEWIKTYEEGKSKGTIKENWNDYVDKQYQELSATRTELDKTATDLANAAKGGILSTDFSAIAGGTANKNAKTNFATALHLFNSELDDQVDTIWNELLEGKFDEFERLTGLTVSTETKRATKAA